MQQQSAENLSQDVLLWLTRHEDLLPVFLNATGSDIPSVRAGFEDPELLAAGLDFLWLDDAWVIAFCQDHDLPLSAPSEARAVLPGGAAVHWT